MGTTYKSAGVDIDAGDALVDRIKPHAARTKRNEVLSGVGGFGGLFALPPNKYKEPVLVSGTDGVGTKLKIAFELNRHDTVGIDLVAMSVNDVLTCGAEPLFFLDYFATSKLNVDSAEQVIAGIARGCEIAGCTLLGGETAEVPGFYKLGDYELAGFCVGVVERRAIIDGKSIRPGDVLIGLGSSGLHSNGYSLARKIIEDQKFDWSMLVPGLPHTLGETMLTPTRIYVKEVLALLGQVELKGLAHITGSGIPGNLPRCLPKGVRAVLSEKTWQRSPLFDFLGQAGDVARDEMFSTFNMGLGLIAVVSSMDAAAALRQLHQRGIAAWEVGLIETAHAGAEAEAVIQP